MIRHSRVGGPLPSARSLSAASVVDSGATYNDFTLMVMQWGQFLDHDITHTPITKGDDDAVGVVSWPWHYPYFDY